MAGIITADVSFGSFELKEWIDADVDVHDLLPPDGPKEGNR